MRTRLPMALDADLLAILNARRDADLNGRAANLNGQGRAVEGLNEGNRELRAHVGALLRRRRTARSLTAATEGRGVGITTEVSAAGAVKETGEDVLEAGPAAGHAGSLEAHVSCAAKS